MTIIIARTSDAFTRAIIANPHASCRVTEDGTGIEICPRNTKDKLATVWRTGVIKSVFRRQAVHNEQALEVARLLASWEHQCLRGENFRGFGNSDLCAKSSDSAFKRQVIAIANELGVDAQVAVAKLRKWEFRVSASVGGLEANATVDELARVRDGYGMVRSASISTLNKATELAPEDPAIGKILGKKVFLDFNETDYLALLDKTTSAKSIGVQSPIERATSVESLPESCDVVQDVAQDLIENFINDPRPWTQKSVEAALAAFDVIRGGASIAQFNHEIAKALEKEGGPEALLNELVANLNDAQVAATSGDPRAARKLPGLEAKIKYAVGRILNSGKDEPQALEAKKPAPPIKTIVGMGGKPLSQSKDWLMVHDHNQQIVRMNAVSQSEHDAGELMAVVKDEIAMQKRAEFGLLPTQLLLAPKVLSKSVITERQGQIIWARTILRQYYNLLVQAAPSVVDRLPTRQVDIKQVAAKLDDERTQIIASQNEQSKITREYLEEIAPELDQTDRIQVGAVVSSLADDAVNHHVLQYQLHGINSLLTAIYEIDTDPEHLRDIITSAMKIAQDYTELHIKNTTEGGR